MNVNKNSVLKYLLSICMGVCLSVFAYYLQPERWKAEALLKLGSPSESAEAAIERIKSKSFIKAVADRSKVIEVAALLRYDQGAGMKLKSVRNSDLVALTVVGASSELVRISIESLVSELISRHDEIFNQFRAGIQKELEVLDSEIPVLVRRVKSLEESGSYAKSVDGLLILSTQSALERKLERSSKLRESISASNLRRTAIMESIYVEEDLIIPSLRISCLLGLLMGICFAYVFSRVGRRQSHVRA